MVDFLRRPVGEGWGEGLAALKPPPYPPPAGREKKQGEVQGLVLAILRGSRGSSVRPELGGELFWAVRRRFAGEVFTDVGGRFSSQLAAITQEWHDLVQLSRRRLDYDLVWQVRPPNLFLERCHVRRARFADEGNLFWSVEVEIEGAEQAPKS